MVLRNPDDNPTTASDVNDFLNQQAKEREANEIYEKHAKVMQAHHDLFLLNTYIATAVKTAIETHPNPGIQEFCTRLVNTAAQAVVWQLRGGDPPNEDPTT